MSQSTRMSKRQESNYVNPNPMSYYSREAFVNFAGSEESRNKVKAMAIFKYKKNYPGEQIIIYETDVYDAMCFALDTKFRQNHNLRHLILDATERLYQTIIENSYAEDELYDEYTNVLHRVHETTQVQSVAACKNQLKDKCYYSMGNIM